MNLECDEETGLPRLDETEVRILTDLGMGFKVSTVGQHAGISTPDAIQYKLKIIYQKLTPTTRNITRAVIEGLRRGILKELASKDVPDLEKPLSLRQREICQLIADGRSNSEIADVLDISDETVSNHISANPDRGDPGYGILWKLHAQNRTEAAVNAYLLKLIK